MIRCAIDTGGTFTDLAVEDAGGAVAIYKCPTTPADPVEGVINVLRIAADARAMTLSRLLSDVDILIHGTTRSTNAVLTGTTARTALLSTLGHRDLLLLREGGRTRPFDWEREYPEPYVPRSLTFEVPERVDAQGDVLRALDERRVAALCRELAAVGVEAVAVCLLWSIVNPAHELRVGELLDEHLPGVPYTLSHRLNPTLREYRRASSTAIDASLKPLMGHYLGSLEGALRDAGFDGQLLVVSTSGGLMRARDMAETPIHSINSGPAMAPVAGRRFAELDGDADDAIVADTGGTSYDVSMVHAGRIPMTRETWLGEQYTGHITGFPAIDVNSIGAGGGSIAWIDEGGLLHVGPQSAGADPGPAAYGRGGDAPTVTDACVLLGYLDPDGFLDATMRLDADRASAVIDRDVARPLGLEPPEAASAILALATEQMVQAIAEVTVDRGVDPRGAVLVGGGGAAGLNGVAVMRRLGCRSLIVPEASAALSAVGALMADLSTEHAAAVFTSTGEFDHAAVDSVITELERRSAEFVRRVGAAQGDVELVAEARLSRQVWQIDVPLQRRRFGGDQAAVDELRSDFQRLHEEIFAVRDDYSEVEVVALRARVTCPTARGTELQFSTSEPRTATGAHRDAYFPGHGRLAARVCALHKMAYGEAVAGPAIIESPFSTIVVDPGSTAMRRASGSLVVTSSRSEMEEGSAHAGAIGD
jgi:N-methylhydantoinase A